MKKFFIVFLCAFASQIMHAQSDLTTEQADKYATMFNNAGGTFQFQIIDTREKPTIPISYIETIEAARDEEEIVYISFKENVRVKILPKNLVSSGKYEALERFEYINSSDLK